jgi:hypothetical protein
MDEPSSRPRKRRREEKADDSDSDDSDSDDSNSRKKRSIGTTMPPVSNSHSSPLDFMVDWDHLAASRFGQDSLLRFLSIPERDTLVGWATHVDDSEIVEDPNPLAGLPNQLPPSPAFREYMSTVARGILSSEKNESDLWESFDQSAMVAIGIVMEETLTATLLPLAQKHVQRCQRLESMPDSEEQTFREWTLPPEQAIRKLLDDGESLEQGFGLATTRLCTRAAVPSAAMPRPETAKEYAALLWCQTHGLNPIFAKKNMDILRVLLSNKPSER